MIYKVANAIGVVAVCAGLAVLLAMAAALSLVAVHQMREGSVFYAIVMAALSMLLLAVTLLEFCTAIRERATEGDQYITDDAHTNLRARHG